MGDRLAGRIAVVVGGGQAPGRSLGNGRACALLFAREGARVLVVDRDPDSAAGTCEAVAGEGGEARACVADVTRPGDCTRIAEEAIRHFGRIDVLVNNVGTGSVGGPVETSLDEWRRVFDTNLTGMFLTCKAVLPHMERAGSGAIVNVSSIAAIRFAPYPMVAYHASKGGVNAFTRAVAMQYASRGIRANAVLPGLIETPMAMEGLSRALGIPYEELKRRRDRAVPMGHMGEALDVARAVLFLASDEAKYVTGVVLPVDGGLSLKG